MPRPGTQATCSEAHVPAVPEAEPDDSEAELADSRTRSLTMPGRADQVPRARAFIARVLAAGGLDCETACLLGSELVTNSVQHSDSRLPGGTVTITVTVAPGEIFVGVTDDGGPNLPVLRGQVTPCAEEGRGLLLVAALSARWGYHRARGGLTTWFRIRGESVRPSLAHTDRDGLAPPHAPEPVAGAFRTPDGRCADLFTLRHYPVRAICRVCGKEIEAESFLAPFEHIGEKSS